MMVAMRSCRDSPSRGVLGSVLMWSCAVRAFGPPLCFGTVSAREAAAQTFGCQAKCAQDALRHTFASYAVALTSDPGRVAIWLGHEGNPTMLHRHYRGIATEADARRFFALMPN